MPPGPLARAKLAYVAPTVYRLTHGRWRTRRPAEPVPGYSLLLTVPPDLPVFLRLAAAVCARQDPEGLVEALVIPDRVTPEFHDHFRAFADRWSGPARLVELGPLNRAVRARTANTSVIHWLQILSACDAARSTHALLHDVDLFLYDRGFFRDRFHACRDRGLACLGVTVREDMALGVDTALGRPTSDRVVFPELAHLVSTWELMFDLRWARSFRPCELRPRYVTLRGLLKHLDTLHLAQLRAGPDRVACDPATGGFLHFGGVITEYRFFQWARGPYADRMFRVLLIRLLVDALDPDTPGYDLPTLDELIEGIGRPDRRAWYPTDDDARAAFRALRDDLRRLIASDLFDARTVAALGAGLDRFDRRYEPPAV